MLEPDNIKAEAKSLWDSGRPLRAWLGAEELFPWSLPLTPSRGGLPVEESEAVRAWKEGMEAGCKCAAGEGYRIEYREIEHPYLGRQRLPERAVFDAPVDLVGYLGKGEELAEFARLAQAIRGRFPALRGWIAETPMRVLEQREEWPRLLAVLEWCVAHHRSDRRRGELEVPGVDTGFIEEHKGLLAELLHYVLPYAATDRQPHGS